MQRCTAVLQHLLQPSVHHPVKRIKLYQQRTAWCSAACPPAELGSAHAAEVGRLSRLLGQGGVVEQASCHRVQGQIELVVPPAAALWLVSRLERNWGNPQGQDCIARRDCTRLGPPHIWNENSVYMHAAVVLSSSWTRSAVMVVTVAGKELYCVIVGLSACLRSGFHAPELETCFG